MNNVSSYRAALDAILPTIEKPVRYVGGEWNSINKNKQEEKVEISNSSNKKKPVKEKTQKRGIGEYSEEMAKQLDM